MGISGESRKIELRGGGSLSVKLEGVSWMHFDEDERTLFVAIIDAMHAYEQKRREQPPSADASDPQAPDPGTLTTRETTSSSSSSENTGRRKDLEPR